MCADRVLELIEHITDKFGAEAINFVSDNFFVDKKRVADICSGIINRKIYIKWHSDLRIDTFCASGHGGQSVNTTYSAVRITHIPTNTVVSCQDEKSQVQNKKKAMKVLKSRILAQVEAERHAEMSAERKSQIGSGDRSEKIRTYNYPQDRITDHRIKKSWHGMDKILDGDLEEVINELKKVDQ